MTMTDEFMTSRDWDMEGDRLAHEADRANWAYREMQDEYANRLAPPATMSEAHSEWHLNAGVPMGQPGCPQDACHPPEPYADDRAEMAEREWVAATVKCGNKAAHNGQPGYHHTSSGVKECYASTGRFTPTFSPRSNHATGVVVDEAMPVMDVDSAVEKMRAAQERKDREEAAAKRARYAAWRSIPVYVGGRGYYALEMSGTVHFFKVERPTEGKHAGKTFVKEQAGDAFHQMGWVRAGEVMDAIAADPGAAGALYGQQINKCYRCHRTLTDTDSRALGMGPDCSKK